MAARARVGSDMWGRCGIRRARGTRWAGADNLCRRTWWQFGPGQDDPGVGVDGQFGPGQGEPGIGGQSGPGHLDPGCGIGGQSGPGHLYP